MKAMILAAGRGERLRPLTDKLPKPLLPIAGRPLIEHHLLALAAAGFEQVAINVAHLPDRIMTALGRGERFGLAIHYSREPPGALDTGGGIRQALAWLGPQPFAVVNGDIFTDFDYAVLRAPLAAAVDAKLWLVPNPAHHPDGDFGLQHGLIVDGPPRYTFAGIGVYRPTLFAGPQPLRFGLIKVLWPAIAAGRVGGALHAGRWYDVGRLQTLQALETRFG